MCVTPVKIGENTVACRQCWQCKSAKVDDVAGRCIAEKMVSTKTFVLTLTYEGDKPETAVLNYKDVQNALKLHRHEYAFRYLVVGEYGSEKGRAHWHLIIFYKGPFPVYRLLERYNHDLWKHGFVYVEEFDYRRARYLLKYLNKDERKARDYTHASEVHYSLKPPLGRAYFDQYAQRYVDQGLAPKGFGYTFPDVNDADGTLHEFWMSGKTQKRFMAEYLKRWSAQKPQPLPFTVCLNQYLTGMLKNDLDLEGEQVFAEIEKKARHYNVEPSKDTGREIFPQTPEWRGVIVKAVGCYKPERQVVKDVLGQWFLVGTYKGNVVWQRGLRSRAELRQALNGTLEELDAEKRRRFEKEQREKAIRLRDMLRKSANKGGTTGETLGHNPKERQSKNGPTFQR